MKLLFTVCVLFVCTTFNLFADDRVVLVEFSTDTDCGPCVGAAKTLNDVAASLGRKNLAIVAYHTYPPTGIDPFYQTDIPELTARANFYGIGSNPQIFINGQQQLNTSENVLLAEINNVVNDSAAQLTISLTGSFSSGSQSGNVNVHFSKSPSSNFKLFAVITETGIDYPAALNGEVTHNDVFQGTLGGWAGMATGNGDITLPFTIGRDSSTQPLYLQGWNSDSCRIIVWLQSGKYVSQAAQIWVTDLTPSDVRQASTPSSAALQMFPNPTRNSVALQYSDRSRSTRLSIVDLLGRTMFTASGDALPSRLDLSSYPAGVYRAVMSRNGAVIRSSPLIRN